jgi:hypothetical protein
MDERIEQAFAVANYMATLSNQRRIILEEFNQKLIYYSNGGTFKIDYSLINFTKNALEMGHDSEVPFIDANNFPILISDVQTFYNNIIEIYFQAINEYSVKFAEIKSKRKIEDIVSL